jgi:predicted CoA-binding protein/catechol 2,3-dioxygenase-like lactoylglutathione lyase family enzyme
MDRRMMEPRISIITLGVGDLDRAIAFYEAMGLARSPAITDGVAFFQMGGSILALWPRAELARDAGVEDEQPVGFGSAALAYNTRTDAEVDEVLAAAEKAGGRIVKPAGRAFWGGWYGYFSDRDGHLWEVAHNPAFPIASDGTISLPRMNHDRYDDSYVSGILNTVRSIAMVGASPNDVRPSFFVLKYLLAKGFVVFPVNPGHAGKQILGREVYARLADIPEPVDMVEIFRTSAAAPGIVEEALAMKPRPKVVWMQLSVRNDEAAARAEAAGLKVVMNRCPKIEYGRLSGEIGWSGVNSRVLSAKKPLMRQGFQKLGLRGRRKA